jgi:hypothetical protein
LRTGTFDNFDLGSMSRWRMSLAHLYASESQMKTWKYIAAATLIALASGLGYYALVVKNATSSVAVPEIPCNESEWQQSEVFDIAAWSEGRRRTWFVSVIKKSFVGKSREEVEKLLGFPIHYSPTRTSKSYRYLLGYLPYVECKTALSQWLIVSFGDDDKVDEITLFKEH